MNKSINKTTVLFSGALVGAAIAWPAQAELNFPTAPRPPAADEQKEASTDRQVPPPDTYRYDPYAPPPPVRRGYEGRYYDPYYPPRDYGRYGGRSRNNQPVFSGFPKPQDFKDGRPDFDPSFRPPRMTPPWGENKEMDFSPMEIWPVPGTGNPWHYKPWDPGAPWGDSEKFSEPLDEAFHDAEDFLADAPTMPGGWNLPTFSMPSPFEIGEQVGDQTWLLPENFKFRDRDRPDRYKKYFRKQRIEQAREAARKKALQERKQQAKKQSEQKGEKQEKSEKTGSVE